MTGDMTRTQDHIEEQCLADYEAHKNKILLATRVECYISEDQLTIDCDPPARVRVRDRVPENDIRRWTDAEWCDPYWDVDLVEPHPALDRASSMWVYGISRSIDGEIQGGDNDWRLDENQLSAPEPQPDQTCPGCGHPPSTTMSVDCPHCGESLTITVVAEGTAYPPKEEP